MVAYERWSQREVRLYYKQPIKFLVVKVNGSWEDLILIQFRTAIFTLLEEEIFLGGFTSTFSVGLGLSYLQDEP